MIPRLGWKRRSTGIQRVWAYEITEAMCSGPYDVVVTMERIPNRRPSFYMKEHLGFYGKAHCDSQRKARAERARQRRGARASEAEGAGVGLDDDDAAPDVGAGGHEADEAGGA